MKFGHMDDKIINNCICVYRLILVYVKYLNFIGNVVYSVIKLMWDRLYI